MLTLLATLGRYLAWALVAVAASAGLFFSGFGLGVGLFGPRPPQAAALPTAAAAPAPTLAPAAAPTEGDPAPVFGPWIDEPILQVQFETLTPALAQQAGLGVDAGALVRTVTAGGLGFQAGLRPDDVIQGVDDLPVDGVHALDQVILALHRQGAFTLTVWRGGQILTLPIDLTHPRDDVQA